MTFSIVVRNEKSLGVGLPLDQSPSGAEFLG